MTTTSPQKTPAKPAAAPTRPNPAGATPAKPPAKTTPRKPPVDLSVISLDDIVPVAPSAATAAKLRPANKRSDEQKKVDELALKLYERWIEAGKPKDWEGENSIPKIVFPIAPEKAAAMRLLIRKAGVFHGKRIRWGREGVRNNDGLELVAFGVIDPTPGKKRKPKTETAAASTAAAKK